eukprot:7160267-Heterocapsa_arctica.AAC.1
MRGHARLRDPLTGWQPVEDGPGRVTARRGSRIARQSGCRHDAPKGRGDGEEGTAGKKNDNAW